MPAALQLALVALNATWDARSNTLSLATRPQANQPLLTTKLSLSSATLYVLPVRQPRFYAAAPADPSKAVNLSDPTASLSPANRIPESAFPTVTSFKRGRGVGEAPTLSYTLLHNSTQGSFRVVPGTQGTTWQLCLRARGAQPGRRTTSRTTASSRCAALWRRGAAGYAPTRQQRLAT